MKISIAMATYNGANYLREQLDSFVDQTRQPDELVACDDGSSDDTLQILYAFQREAPFDVHIHRNPENLGYAMNFNKAMGMCNGEIVFLSDQDDFWFPGKIEQIAGLMKSNEKILLVINNQEITNEKLNSFGITTLGQYKLARRSSDLFIQGCCSAISYRLLKLVLPIPIEVSSHDDWIHKIGCALEVRMVVDEVLQYYRRHDRNISQGPVFQASDLTNWDLIRHAFPNDSHSLSTKRLDHIERCVGRLQAVMEQRAPKPLPERWLENAIDRFEQERSAVQARLHILERPRPYRLLPAFSNWVNGRYSYFSGWKSLLKDLVK